MTFEDPCTTTPGPPGTQLANMHVAVCEVTTAAGLPPIVTDEAPFTIASGIAGWGVGVGVGAGG